MRAHAAEQNERDPVVDRRNKTARRKPQHPAQQWRSEGDEAEDQTNFQRLNDGRARPRSAFTQRGDKGVDGERER